MGGAGSDCSVPFPDREWSSPGPYLMERFGADFPLVGGAWGRVARCLAFHQQAALGHLPCGQPAGECPMNIPRPRQTISMITPYVFKIVK